MPNRPQRVVVVGGGISGLAAAHRLREIDPSVAVTLFEASPRFGGVLRTSQQAGFLVEHSADNFITNVPHALDLAKRIGLEEELIGTDPVRRRAFVVCGERLEPVPDGFVLMSPNRVWPVLTTPILSVAGKMRLMWEYFVPRRESAEDESLASFARRRLGDEVFDRLVQPLIGGIYTADPEKLSMRATLPRFLEMEREHGSLLRAARKQAAVEDVSGSQSSGARYGMFVSFRRGMQTLVDRLVERLDGAVLRTETTVERIVSGPPWQVHLTGGETLDAEAVILALPAYRSARLLEPIDAALADDVGAIEYAGASVVVTGHRREDLKPIEGFGFVVPAVEKRRILACSFASHKFPGRAPREDVLLRTFVGGALQPSLAHLPDEELFALVRDELGELLGLQGKPRFQMVCRWDGKMPQYHVGHVERVDRIFSRLERHAGLGLCGNAFRGVGVPQCIQLGEQAAERVLHAAPAAV